MVILTAFWVCWVANGGEKGLLLLSWGHCSALSQRLGSTFGRSGSLFAGILPWLTFHHLNILNSYGVLLQTKAWARSQCCPKGVSCSYIWFNWLPTEWNLMHGRRGAFTVASCGAKERWVEVTTGNQYRSNQQEQHGLGETQAHVSHATAVNASSCLINQPTPKEHRSSSWNGVSLRAGLIYSVQQWLRAVSIFFAVVC